jgi:hypothetical protein
LRSEDELLDAFYFGKERSFRQDFAFGLGEEEMLDSGDLISDLRDFRPGDSADLTVANNGEESRVTVDLGNAAKEKRKNVQYGAKNQNGAALFGRVLCVAGMALAVIGAYSVSVALGAVGIVLGVAGDAGAPRVAAPDLRRTRFGGGGRAAAASALRPARPRLRPGRPYRGRSGLRPGGRRPGAAITGFGDALWWSATLVTTISSELYPVTVPGRILGIFLMLYAVRVFSYFIASITSVRRPRRPAAARRAYRSGDHGASEPRRDRGLRSVLKKTEEP